MGKFSPPTQPWCAKPQSAFCLSPSQCLPSSDRLSLSLACSRSRSTRSRTSCSPRGGRTPSVSRRPALTVCATLRAASCNVALSGQPMQQLAVLLQLPQPTRRLRTLMSTPDVASMLRWMAKDVRGTIFDGRRDGRRLLGGPVAGCGWHASECLPVHGGLACTCATPDA